MIKAAAVHGADGKFILVEYHVDGTNDKTHLLRNHHCSHTCARQTYMDTFTNRCQTTSNTTPNKKKKTFSQTVVPRGLC